MVTDLWNWEKIIQNGIFNCSLSGTKSEVTEFFDVKYNQLALYSIVV